MSSKANFPTVVIVEEGMREGRQIERPGIPVSRKVELLGALSRTGIRRIAVGSFVSAKWVPQMAEVDELVAAFTPVVQMLEAEGISTGIDLKLLVEAAKLAEEILGHPLNGHVSKAGPMPYGNDLYPEDLPRIETLDQAQHFRLGRSVYAGMPSPWNRPTAVAEDRER